MDTIFRQPTSHIKVVLLVIELTPILRQSLGSDGSTRTMRINREIRLGADYNMTPDHKYKDW